MKLSILIPSVMSRRKTFLPKILDQIEPQLTEGVELLTLIDNKTTMLGEKRNIMVDMAQGEYVVFVDDDDRISDNYVESLLKATEQDPDIITFKAEVTENGGKPTICIYNKNFERDHNTETYNRLPNHICCVKKELSQKVEYPSVVYGEDSGYSKKLKPLIKTQVFIDDVLYYYDFNTETTEAQLHLRSDRKLKRKPILDLVILSNAKEDKFRELTEQAIRTAKETSQGYEINIIVMEQNPEVTYSETTIHYDYPFNYNKVANHGARSGNADWIMIANNDLIFKEDWLFELLKVSHPVMSPKCPRDGRQTLITKNTYGGEIGKTFSGWCFMINRETFNRINGLDEDFEFWYADNATIKQLSKIGIIPMLVANSFVEHLGSQTLNSLSETEKQEKTFGQTNKFKEKYGQ